MIGSAHAAVLASSPLADLACCCDSDPRAEDRVPPGVPFTTELREALTTPGLEAVFVCTPQADHAGVVQAACEQGLAVFCEKPIADTLAAARAIVEAAAAASAPVVIGHILRFEPRYRAVVDAVSSGELGQVLLLSARRNAPRSEGAMLAGRTSIAVELAVHDIDL